MENKKIIIIVVSIFVLAVGALAVGVLIIQNIAKFDLSLGEKPTLPDGDYSNKQKSTNNDFDKIAYDLETKYHKMFYQLNDYGEESFNKIVRKAISLGFKFYNKEKIYSTGYNPPRYLTFHYYHKYEKPYTIILEVEYDHYDNFATGTVTVEKDLQK